MANALWHNGDAFGDDQPGACTLGIVLNHERCGNMVRRAAQTGKWRHNNSVWQLNLANTG